MRSATFGWHGSFAVIVTPFTRDGDIDEAAYREIVDLVIEDGCHGVISAGSTGEFFLMTADERKRVFAIAADQAGGRIPVLGGTSATRTEDVIDLTRAAAQAKCNGVMVLPPIYVRLQDRELIEFYRRVSEEGGLPVMVYNSPLAVRSNLTPQLVQKLMQLDNVVAIKDSSRDLQQVAQVSPQRPRVTRPTRRFFVANRSAARRFSVCANCRHPYLPGMRTRAMGPFAPLVTAPLGRFRVTPPTSYLVPPPASCRSRSARPVPGSSSSTAVPPAPGRR